MASVSMSFIIFIIIVLIKVLVLHLSCYEAIIKRMDYLSIKEILSFKTKILRQT